MIYLGHYSSLLVLPFSFLVFFFFFFYPIRRERGKSFLLLLFFFLSPVGVVNKVLEQECKTWCLVRMLTNEIFFLNSLSTNRVYERKESINRVYNKETTLVFLFLSPSSLLSLYSFNNILTLATSKERERQLTTKNTCFFYKLCKLDV
jgi:hypothetical protein